MKINALDWMALLVVLIGALNWGLVGLLDWNLIDWLFIGIFGLNIIARIIYIVVAIAGAYLFASMLMKKPEVPPAA